MTTYSSNQDFAVAMLTVSNVVESLGLPARTFAGHNNKVMQLDQMHRAMGWKASTVDDWNF